MNIVAVQKNTFSFFILYSFKIALVILFHS